jgi:hypothetical protein
MINRSMPDAPPELVLTQAEIELLNHFVKDNKRSSQALPISRYLIKIAQLGRLPISGERPASRQHSHVARTMPPHGYTARLRPGR